MEKPIPPNPDTMTDEEFDKWLEAEFIWESEQIEKALFPDGIPEDTSTPEEKEAAWQLCLSVRTGHTENLQRSGEMKTECSVLDMQMALGFITHLNQPA